MALQKRLVLVQHIDGCVLARAKKGQVVDQRCMALVVDDQCHMCS